MERQIEQRDFTLIVCTETYRRRFMDDETAAVGRGVVWEARILRNLLYADTERHGRIVPVLFESGDGAFVPTVFRGHFYDVSDDRGFESLLRHLLREPGAKAAPLGALGPQGSRWSAFERPWLVPDALRTSYFTGREDLLARLRIQLSERGRAALGGLGGVGKTQTVLEYAVRHRADYPDGVFWINAETLSGLTNGFIAIATMLGLPAADANDQEEAVKAVLAWLNGTNGWLQILDNVDERGDVRRFVPPPGKGHLLITSRETVFQELGIARAIDLRDLDDDEAVRFLLLRTGREDAELDDQAAASALASELGNLPLALEQAAAYIVETNTDFSAYVSAFRKRRITLLEKAGGLLSRETVAVTWAANFEAVERVSPAAADALRISALLAPDAIPFELFIEGARALSDPIAATLAEADDLAMAEMLRPLARYSLIRSDPASREFSVHRLVQEIVWAAVPEAERPAYVMRAIGALDAAFPEADFVNWARCDRLVPHVTAMIPWLERYDGPATQACRVLNRAGRYLTERGRYDGAKRLLEHAVAIGERGLGIEAADVGESLANLAVVHMCQGDYATARALHERALAIRRREFGPDHSVVAGNLNNLANVHYVLGHLAEAQLLYQQALTIQERAFGREHHAVATSINNLAIIDSEQGRYAEAQRLNEDALAIRERTLGPDHPHVALSLCNLAETMRKQRHYGAAQRLHERALEIRERVFGPHNVDVAESLDGLGMLQSEQGRHAQARPLYERALAIREHALGLEHPDLVVSLNGLAGVALVEGRLFDAESLFGRALALQERALAPDHPGVAATLAGLASLREAQARNADAHVLVKRALAIRERTFDAGHPELAALRERIETLRAAI